MRLIGFICALLAVPAQALAQGSYPTRPVRFVVPYSAGGIADLVARAIAPGLSASLGQPVVIENRAGAGGHIAANEIARGPVDGHAVVLTTIAHNAAQSMYSNLAYDPAKDLKPVVLISEAASVLVVHTAVAARSVPELLALAKFPNVAVKATGGPSYSTHVYPYRNIHSYIKQIFDAFGPERMFWGTDITRMPCTYRQCVTMFTEEMPWLKGRDLELVMGRALCNFIGWNLKG